MSDNLVRHLVSALLTIVCLLAFFGGYISGVLGIWWTGFIVLVVYGGVYKIIDL